MERNSYLKYYWDDDSELNMVHGKKNQAYFPSMLISFKVFVSIFLVLSRRNYIFQETVSFTYSQKCALKCMPETQNPYGRPISQ